VEEQLNETMVIHASPACCYEVLTDFERYPAWASDIKSVSIDERDDEGRPAQVTFRAAAFGRSTSYTLRYDYSGAPTRLSWQQVRGDVTRRLEGSYEILPSDDGFSDVSYHLVVELKVPLPVFVKRRAEGRIAHAALKELQARAEG
jgi:ribosome-associated toxin RatA of RatAB toxin-antitoxin module